MTSHSLLSYIKSHNHITFVLPCGNLRVRTVWTHDGNAGRTWETIPATSSAVRNWLGY